MDLYLLKLKPGSGPAYDVVNGAVVRASSYQSAREIAAASCQDEGETVWRDNTHSSCKMIAANVIGVAEVVLQNTRG